MKNDEFEDGSFLEDNTEDKVVETKENSFEKFWGPIIGVCITIAVCIFAIKALSFNFFNHTVENNFYIKMENSEFRLYQEVLWREDNLLNSRLTYEEILMDLKAAKIASPIVSSSSSSWDG